MWCPHLDENPTLALSAGLWFAGHGSRLPEVERQPAAGQPKSPIQSTRDGSNRTRFFTPKDVRVLISHPTGLQLNLLYTACAPGNSYTGYQPCIKVVHIATALLIHELQTLAFICNDIHCWRLTVQMR
jgi:hypothetical protein